MDEPHREVADRLAMRALVDLYAQRVDRRDTAGVAGLFSADGRLVSHFGSGPGWPIVRTGRDDITAALVEGLARYQATTHVVGGQVVQLDGDSAGGETTCLAHHVYERRGTQRLLVLAVRYADEYVREHGTWCFAERQLRLDWRDDRVLEAAP
ncbi:MAG: nuclear transport factor 2 family protein [Acidimicrobiales bacterium]|jgi:hypothetical protein